MRDGFFYHLFFGIALFDKTKVRKGELERIL